jgi:YVTN family beta-propeller protein
MQRASLYRWWLLLLSVLALFASGCHLIVAPTPLALDSMGARVYVLDPGESMSIRVVDARTNMTIARIPLGVSPVGIAVNPSNGEIYVASRGSVFVIDTSSDQVMATVPVEAGIEALAVNTVGTRLFVLHGHPDGISVIDTGARRLVRTLDAGSPSAMLAVPGVDHLVLAQSVAKSGNGPGDARISLLETDGLSAIAATSVETFLPLGLAFDPSGSRLYAVGVTGFDEKSQAGRFLTLETGGYRVVADSQIALFPVAIAVNPTGTRVYVVAITEKGAALIVIATSSNAVLETVAVREGPLALAVSASGTEVYISHSDGTLSIVNTATNRVMENRP